MYVLPFYTYLCSLHCHDHLATENHPFTLISFQVCRISRVMFFLFLKGLQLRLDTELEEKHLLQEQLQQREVLNHCFIHLHFNTI